MAFEDHLVVLLLQEHQQVHEQHALHLCGKVGCEGVGKKRKKRAGETSKENKVGERFEEEFSFLFKLKYLGSRIFCGILVNR